MVYWQWKMQHISCIFLLWLFMSYKIFTGSKSVKWFQGLVWIIKYKMILRSCIDYKIYLLHCHYCINRCYMYYYEGILLREIWFDTYDVFDKYDVQLQSLSVFKISTIGGISLLVMLGGLLFIHQHLKLDSLGISVYCSRACWLGFSRKIWHVRLILSERGG